MCFTYSISKSRIAREFGETMRRLAPSMGNRIAAPTTYCLKDDRTESYVNACKEVINNQVQVSFKQFQQTPVNNVSVFLVSSFLLPDSQKWSLCRRQKDLCGDNTHCLPGHPVSYIAKSNEGTNHNSKDCHADQLQAGWVVVVHQVSI